MKTYLVSFSYRDDEGLQIGNIVVDLELDQMVNSNWIDELESSLEALYSTEVIVMSFSHLPDEQ